MIIVIHKIVFWNGIYNGHDSQWTVYRMAKSHSPFVSTANRDVENMVRIFTSCEKEGMKGSNKHARRYTSPAEVLITTLQEGLSSL